MIKNAYNRVAWSQDVKELFGFKREEHWPDEGVDSTLIQGIWCWVDPLQPGKFRLRARCSCPQCGRDVPIGRLRQHSKVHTGGDK